MSISEEQVLNALKAVRYPGFTRDIVSFGLVKSVEIENGEVKVQLALATNDPNIPATIKNEAENVLRGIGAPNARSLDRYPRAPGRRGRGDRRSQNSGHQARDRGRERQRAASGKSTVAANLAVALEKSKARVGLCDCDIYGPSIALMFGTRERPMATEDNQHRADRAIRI